MFSLIATTTLIGFFKPNFAYADVVEPVPIVQQIPQYCSCVSYVRNFIPSLPHMDAVWFATLPRSTPAVGRVAIFNYSGVYHVAYIESLGDTGFTVREANFKPCEKDRRFIEWNDDALVGFWAPAS